MSYGNGWTTFEALNVGHVMLLFNVTLILKTEQSDPNHLVIFIVNAQRFLTENANPPKATEHPNLKTSYAFTKGSWKEILQVNKISHKITRCVYRSCWQMCCFINYFTHKLHWFNCKDVKVNVFKQTRKSLQPVSYTILTMFYITFTYPR